MKAISAYKNYRGFYEKIEAGFVIVGYLNGYEFKEVFRTVALTEHDVNRAFRDRVDCLSGIDGIRAGWHKDLVLSAMHVPQLKVLVRDEV